MRLALSAVCACVVLSVPTAATAAPVAISRSGAGPVKLGMTYTALRARGLVSRIGPGCELGGPQTRSARLRAPLTGSVDFTLTSPRRVASITITGGGAARGVGIGATRSAIRRAYPNAVFRPDEVFAGTFANVGPRSGGRLSFFLPDDARVVTAIGVPYIAACE